MRRALLALAVAFAVPGRGAAQDSTGVVLRRARELYEQIELERALPLFRQVVSPGWPFEVTGAQRVEAHTYLGALLVLVGSRDSALTHFRAALERDPFADLDPAQFTPAQLDAFGAARRLVFALAVRPVAPARLDPRTERLTFTIVVTHRASLRAEIRPAGGGPVSHVLDSEVEGLREIAWDGLLANGQVAPSGRYALLLTGRSRVLDRRDSTGIYFDVRQDFPPLEDTLPELGSRDVLPEHYTTSAAKADLLKGLGVAAGAFLIANLASNRHLDRRQGMATVMATAGLAVGVGTFVTRHARGLAENVAVNARRRTERVAANDAIRRRNADRVAQTILLITPAAGPGP